MPTILAVDDDESVLKPMRQTLEAKGYAVVTAKTGEDALEYVASNPAPDLVLLDVSMPGISGFETCRRLRKAPKTASVPIILLTGSGDMKALKEGKDAGSDIHLVKPVPGHRLLSFVGMFLSEKALERRQKSTSGE